MKRFLRAVMVVLIFLGKAQGMVAPGDFGIKLTHLKNKLTDFKTSLDQLKQKIVDLKNVLTVTKTSWKLHDKSRVDVTFDVRDQIFRADIKDENGVLVARLTLKQNHNQGALTLADEVFDKVKETWYESATYTLEMIYDDQELWEIKRPNGWSFRFYKITQKDLDVLASTNPYKHRDWVGKYQPQCIFIDIKQGTLEWDSKTLVDHQPTPPWIEVAVRAFAEVVWPLAHGSKPLPPVTEI